MQLTMVEKVYEALKCQVDIMRTILTSLEQEKRAIVAGASDHVLEILEERLTLVSAFQRWNGKLISSIGFKKEKGPLPDYSELLEKISCHFDCAHVELHVLRSQAEVLIQEIYSRNVINGQLFKENRSALPQPIAIKVETRAQAIAVATLPID